MSLLKSEIRLLILNVSFAHSRPTVRSTNSKYDNSRDLLVPLSLMTIELADVKEKTTIMHSKELMLFDKKHLLHYKNWKSRRSK